jgi:glutathione S-transferase
LFLTVIEYERSSHASFVFL